LEEQGLHTFLDSVDIPGKVKGSEEWVIIRDNAVVESKTFIFIITSGVELSLEVRKELTLARKLGDKDFVYFRERSHPHGLMINLENETLDFRKLQQVSFETKEELLRLATRILVKSQSSTASKIIVSDSVSGKKSSNSVNHEVIKKDEQIVSSSKIATSEKKEVAQETNPDGKKGNLTAQEYQQYSTSARNKVEPRISFFQMGQEQQIQRATPVRTGSTTLDMLLCGGIPQKLAVMFTSPPCDEKDVLIKNFLTIGIEYDEPTFYVAIEPRLAGILTRNYSFYLFLCNSQYEDSFENNPNISVCEGVEDLQSLSATLISTARKFDASEKVAKRICLNIISDVILLHGAPQTRRWLTELLTQLKSAGFTTIAFIDPQTHPPEELHAILDLFEGEVDIREIETFQGSRRFLRIKRMSDHRYLKDEAEITDEEEKQNFRRSDFRDSHSGGFVRLS
jgi:KaiC/GvpD/RAD55 family RecA-like ATPase